MAHLSTRKRMRLPLELLPTHTITPHRRWMSRWSARGFRPCQVTGSIEFSLPLLLQVCRFVITREPGRRCLGVIGKRAILSVRVQRVELQRECVDIGVPSISGRFNDLTFGFIGYKSIFSRKEVALACLMFL